MSEQKEENKKTVVSFTVGLLIGGTLVWAFSGTLSTAPTSVILDTATTTATSTETATPTTSATLETSNPTTNNPTATPVATLPVGEGSVSVNDQAAGSAVTLAAATFPIKEGWIGIRDYTNGNLGNILGVARFSELQGLVPSDIMLQRATTAGHEYAVVIFSENGDREFNLANDVQVNKIFATFKAQ